MVLHIECRVIEDIREMVFPEITNYKQVSARAENFKTFWSTNGTSRIAVLGKGATILPLHH